MWRSLSVKEIREKEQWLERDSKRSSRLEHTKVGVHADGNDTVERIDEPEDRLAKRMKFLKD